MQSFFRSFAMSAAGLLAAAFAAASPAPVREFHRVLPLAADGHLSIATYKGSITVTSWNRPEADVTARVEADGTEEDAEEKVARTEVRIDGGGSSVRLRSNYDRVRERGFLGIFGFSKGTLPLVHYTIRMPATARLEITDYKSRIEVAGLHADLKLHTYKGEVVIEDLDGGAEVETYKGDVRISYARYAHASRFETYKGSFAVLLPKDSRFDLEADGGRRGEVDSDFAVAKRTARHGGEHAHGSVNGGGPTLRFESSRGSLRIRATSPSLTPGPAHAPTSGSPEGSTARHVASAHCGTCRSPAGERHRRAARPDAASTARLVPPFASAPAPRGSSLPLVGRLLSGRA